MSLYGILWCVVSIYRHRDTEDVSFHPSLCWSPFIHYSNVPLAVLDSLRRPSLWRESHKNCNGFQIPVIYISIFILANINIINPCYAGKLNILISMIQLKSIIFFYFQWPTEGKFEEVLINIILQLLPSFIIVSTLWSGCQTAVQGPSQFSKLTQLTEWGALLSALTKS